MLPLRAMTPIKCSIPALTCSQGRAALLEPLPAIVVRRHVASSSQGHIERQRQATNHTHTHRQVRSPAISRTFIGSYLSSCLVVSTEAVCCTRREPRVSQGKRKKFQTERPQSWALNPQPSCCEGTTTSPQVLEQLFRVKSQRHV